jgi:hypothetical protein
MFSNDIKTYLNDEKAASRIAGDLALCIKRFLFAEKIDDVGQIDHNFVLSKGKVQSNDANTDFVFDLPRDSEAYGLLKAIYAKDIKDEDNDNIEEFIKKVCVCLTDEHSRGIRDTLRAKVIGDVPEKIVPIETIEVLSIELVDYSAVDEDNKYVLNYHKVPGVPVNMQALTTFVTNAKENDADKTISQIINEERLKGNKIFEGILGVEKANKYLWDVNIALYADYSFSDEFMESQKGQDNTTGVVSS